MSGMLDTLLDINQLEAGIVRARDRRFPDQRCCSTQLRTEFAYHAAAQRLGWRVVPSQLCVRSDPRLLEQMIRNLLSNAVKYTSAAARSCSVAGAAATSCASRSGIPASAFPDDQLRQIFEEFHQLDNPARERSGDSVSVSRSCSVWPICWAIRIDVRSRPGKGSVFAVEVPLGGEHAARPWHRQARAPRKRRADDGTILVVEDEPGVREMLKLLLDGEGHRTVTAADGQTALELAARGAMHPDLVLADYNLPNGLNGLQVVASLQKMLDHELPAIILTGDISTETLARDRPPGLRPSQQAGEGGRTDPRLSSSFWPSRSRPARRALGRAAEATDGAQPPTIFVVDDDSSRARGHARSARGGRQAGRSLRQRRGVPRRPIIPAARAACWSMPGCPA